jgi:hypothetical protein
VRISKMKRAGAGMLVNFVFVLIYKVISMGRPGTLRGFPTFPSGVTSLC